MRYPKIFRKLKVHDISIFRKKYFIKKKKIHTSRRNKIKLSPHLFYKPKSMLVNFKKNFHLKKGWKHGAVFFYGDCYYSVYYNKWYVTVWNNLGVITLAPLTINLELFEWSPKIHPLQFRFRSNYFYAVFLLGVKVSYVALFKGVAATSLGSYAVVVGKWYSTRTIFLPSGKKIYRARVYGMLGSNFSWYLEKINTVRIYTHRYHVRGIAKNPIDHPNGGNSNTKGSFKTPWGEIAKAGK